MAPRLLLFDIDGTLMISGQAGRRAFNRAIEASLGISGAVDAVDFRGATDGRVLRDVLRSAGREPTRELMAEVFRVYVALLREELRGEPMARALPSAAAVLAACARLEGSWLGVGTGNVEGGAWAKLERVGLAAHVRFGGFGSDGDDRAELLRHAVSRGAKLAGCAPEQCEVVVLGDTPRDVEAAHAVGARAVAVMTGGHGREELQACEPDLLVEGLAAPELARLLGIAAVSG